MIRRLLIGVSTGIAILAFTAAPAAAQVKGDVSIGYSFLRFVDEENVPVGWNVSAAGRLNDFVSGIADFGGHYYFSDGLEWTAHTFQGGVRVGARRTSAVIPFAQVTFGGALAAEDNDAEFAWVFQPGAGVDIPIRPGGPALRVQVDFPIYFRGGDGVNGFRFTAGISIPIK